MRDPSLVAAPSVASAIPRVAFENIAWGRSRCW